MPIFPKKTSTAVGEAPTAFKMRSGNHTGLPFKEMGSSPIPSGLMDVLGAFGDDKNKNITAPGSDNKGITIDETKTEKVKPQEIKIKGSDKTTNTSSRPDGDGPTTKTTEPKGEVKIKETESTPDAPKKKGLFGRYRDHVENADGKGSYAKTQDSLNELANSVGNTNKHSTNNAEKATAVTDKKKASQLATQNSVKQNKQNEITANQKTAMHNSNIAVNTQQIENGKALAAQRMQKIDIQEEANSEENNLDATEVLGGKDLSEEGTILG